jgi:tannase
MRYSFQQVNHLTSNVIEQTLGYFPPSCEFDKMVNLTIAACDALDGKTDGVVSRTDLCKLQFNLNSTIGTPYSCPATAATAGFGKRQLATPATPAQNGTITAEGVAVANAILDGLHDSNGDLVYLSYQPAATFADGATQFNSETNSWELSISGLGGEWITRFLELQDTSVLESLDGVTYDTLKAWMIQGLQMYEDTLQTTWPDLTPFHNASGKVIHFHGESDNSIPTASSVRYYESVRSIMYPNLSFNDSTAALDDWYRLFLVPGAAHCSTNNLQPNAPFPQTNLAVLIDWVENGVEPTTLNATVLEGDFVGEQQQICSWPLRPMWSNNGTTMECEYDQASIDTWIYDFNAIKMPVY